MRAKRIKPLFICLFVLIIAAGLFLYCTFLNAYKEMSTRDTIGKIIVTLSRTLYRDTAKNYSLAKELHENFPEVVIENGAVLDAWGNEIKFEINDSGINLEIKITCAGRDGAFGTKDDIEKDLIAKNDTKREAGK